MPGDLAPQRHPSRWGACSPSPAHTEACSLKPAERITSSQLPEERRGGHLGFSKCPGELDAQTRVGPEEGLAEPPGRFRIYVSGQRKEDPPNITDPFRRGVGGLRGSGAAAPAHREQAERAGPSGDTRPGRWMN